MVKKQGWSLEKPLVARMTNSVVENLPEPVVIVRQIDKSGKHGQGKITLNPKENRRHYGNLLDKFQIVTNFLDFIPNSLLGQYYSCP